MALSLKKKSIEKKKAIIKMRIEKGNLIRKQKDEKEIKLLEQKNSIINDIIASGFLIVGSKEELDKLYIGSKPLQRLKEQIRYFNLINGQKIKISGTKKNLYDRLLEHILSKRI